MKNQEEKHYRLIVFDKLTAETREVCITSTSDAAGLISAYQYIVGSAGIVSIQPSEKKQKRGFLKLVA